MEPLRDSWEREIKSVRVSVTDKCNFRCTYCMPAEGLEWLPREEMWNDAYRPSREQLAERTKQLREEIERRLCTLPPLMPGEEEQDG